jgi:hypothetical protein
MVYLINICRFFYFCQLYGYDNHYLPSYLQNPENSKKLKFLSFYLEHPSDDKNEILDEYSNALANFDQLEELNINFSQMHTVEDLEQFLSGLSKIKSLKRLKFFADSKKVSILHNLSKIFKEMPNLKSLVFSSEYNSFQTEADLESFLSDLRSLPQQPEDFPLEIELDIYISSPGNQSEQLKNTLETIRKLPKLSKVTLDKYSVGDLDFKYFIKVLKDMKSLKTLVVLPKLDEITLHKIQKNLPNLKILASKD